jgi:hypothetical protein
MHKPGQRGTELIEKTMNSLSSDVIPLMLLAGSKHNIRLELNIKQAIKWWVLIYIYTGKMKGHIPITGSILHLDMSMGVQKQ